MTRVGSPFRKSNHDYQWNLREENLHNGVNHNGKEKEMAQNVSIIGNNDLPNGGNGERLEESRKGRNGTRIWHILC